MVSTITADIGMVISQNSFQPLMILEFSVMRVIVRNIGVAICVPYGRGLTNP